MFVYKKKILFGDCDAAGILFFANIFRYMHEAYEIFISENLDYAKHFKNDGLAYPVTKTSAEFYSPLELGKTAEIKINVAQIRGNSFELNYGFYIDNELKASGKTVHICIDINGNEKRKLSDELKQTLGEYSNNGNKFHRPEYKSKKG